MVSGRRGGVKGRDRGMSARMNKLAPFLCGGSLMLACSGGTNEPGDAGSDAGADASKDVATDSADAAPSTGCPTVVLPASMPLTYAGDTTGKPNLVTSQRLEWGDAPDDALLFVAPAAATFTVAMTADPSNNGGCGVSAQDYANASTSTTYDESTCPAKGATAAIDGVYTATGAATTDLALAKDQHVLLFVSCTTWSSAQAGAYTLTITQH